MPSAALNDDSRFLYLYRIFTLFDHRAGRTRTLDLRTRALLLLLLH